MYNSLMMVDIAERVDGSDLWPGIVCVASNDLTIGWQNINPLSHPNATLAPQARQVRLSGEFWTMWH